MPVVYLYKCLIIVGVALEMLALNLKHHVQLSSDCVCMNRLFAILLYNKKMLMKFGNSES